MELKIHLEHLKEGNIENFNTLISTKDLLSNEEELYFAESMNLSGKAYLAGDHLILEMHGSVTAWQPCTICNNPTDFTISLSDIHHAIPIEEIPQGILDFSELLRSDILLEVPQFVECQGKCPQREELKKFLHKKQETPHAQFPFSGL